MMLQDKAWLEKNAITIYDRRTEGVRKIARIILRPLLFLAVIATPLAGLMFVEIYGLLGVPLMIICFVLSGMLLLEAVVKWHG